MYLDMTIELTLRITLTLLFATSVAQKIFRSTESLQTVANYLRGFGGLGRLPPQLVLLILIALEASIIKSCLWHDNRVAGLLAAVTLWAYAMAMEINLLRGNVLLDCGCSWGRGHQPVHQALVGRNLFLGALSLVLLLPSQQRSLSALDWTSIIFATLTSIALYVTANQLLTLSHRRTAS